MPHNTQLANNQRSVARLPAQVVALDPRPQTRQASDTRYLRALQLSDLLSRHLEINHIIEAFMTEIEDLVDYCGYEFSCDDVEVSIRQGETAGFSARYRLKIQRRVLGELTVYKRASISSSELCALEDLMCSLLYPIKNAMMYQIALKSAYRDPLTGLNNRTAMEKFLPREIDLAKRHRQAMALLVMDLDGFKQINDHCGHDVGDHVLREVGQVISGVVRNTDLVYRYGGDEFVGGLAQTDLQGAVDVSERIRTAVDALDLNACGSTRKVQISIGITLIRDGDDSLTAFKRADKALYKAKCGGKNQIIIC